MNSETTDIEVSRWSHITPGVGHCLPPEDIFDYVFPQDIRKKWLKNPGNHLLFRLEVIEACGTYPADLIKALWVRRLRARKAAWEAYLFTAYACGMFDGERGRDLLSRLRNREFDGFRSAMAECLACWFLAGHLKFPLDPIARGRGSRNLDMQVLIGQEEVGVEIKAPFRERPESGWGGGESDKIVNAIRAANEQFRDDRPNLLIIVPELRIPMHESRDDLLHAAYGCSELAIPFNTQTGETLEPYERFVPAGCFLNIQKKGKLPGFQRISAIISIEEVIVSSPPSDDLELLFSPPKNINGSIAWVDHKVLVLHNPNAHRALSQELWKDFPQFVAVEDAMKWTDGHPVVI